MHILCRYWEFRVSLSFFENGTVTAEIGHKRERDYFALIISLMGQSLENSVQWLF
jgi:hypothetical protein